MTGAGRLMTMRRATWMAVGLMTLGLVLAAGVAFAAQLKVGSRAPDFSLKSQKGKTVKLEERLGEMVSGRPTHAP